MVRMLARFRERFEWRARTPALAGTVLAALLLVTRVPAAGDRRPTGADRAPPTGWSRSRTATAASGSLAGGDSSAAITGWAMLGLEAAGRNPLDVSKGGRTPGRLPALDGRRSRKQRRLARTILALEGAGRRRRAPSPGATWSARWPSAAASNGSCEGWPGTTAYAVIALRAAGDSGGLDKSLSWLAEVQNGDGGWGDERGKPSTPDNTGAVMQAMRSSKLSQRGLSYLRNAQLSSGGFALGRQRPGQLAVDRLGGAGDDRRRHRSGHRSPPEATRRSTTCSRARTPTATSATRPPATRPRSGSRGKDRN